MRELNHRLSEGYSGMAYGLCLVGMLAMWLVALPASAQKDVPQDITCTKTQDFCAGTLSSLFAISHGYPVAETTTTVLYRVTIKNPSNTSGPQPGSWSPGTHWNDAINGFFYQAIVNGDKANPKVYVPFNGVGIGSDGQPALPPFSFIVPVDVTVKSPTLTISACTTNFAGPIANPSCTQTFWVDTYSSLPYPEQAAPPVPISGNTFVYEACGNYCSQPNNGVYAWVLALQVDKTFDESDMTWVLNHLVFFDSSGDAYLNDIVSQQVGVLPLEEAAYQDPGDKKYYTKYGHNKTGIQYPPSNPPDANLRYLFFYTTSSETSFNIGTAVIHDRPDNCTGFIEPGYTTNTNCSSGGSSDPPKFTTATVTPVEGKPDDSPTKANVKAGVQELRTVPFTLETPSGSTCTKALNPLAVQVTGTGAAYSMPNYVIRHSPPSPNGQSLEWARKFPDGLYYVLPSGFGNCDLTNEAPFCVQSGSSSSPYVAYVPHYQDSNSTGGPLNGGSTTAREVKSFELADEYALGNISGAKNNALVWFDNCGYGHTYVEGTNGVMKLGTRKTLPRPPNKGNTYQYTIKNSLGRSLVFAKECCASWYQQNTNFSPPALEPPQQLDNGFGMVVPVNTGQSSTYQTIFGDEALVVYDGGTGNQLFKLRQTALSNQKSALHSCKDKSATVSISGKSPTFAVDLGGSGKDKLECRFIGACPFGMTAVQTGGKMSCRTTVSSFLLGVSDWQSANLDNITQPLQLRAWGGKGHKGDGAGPYCPAGEGGPHGFALTIMKLQNLPATLNYAYVGSGGSQNQHAGSSTILTTRPLSSLSTPEGITLPSTAGVMLVAGGGGAGGSGEDVSPPCWGGLGGAGGVAIATSGKPVSKRGLTGHSDGAKGGNDNGDGNGGGHSGQDAHDGQSGLGGWGGETHTKWITGGSLIPPTSWSAGKGGGGADCGGHDGAGGFGGGGGGGNSYLWQAGGGGGTWAAANTANDPNAPSSAPKSPTHNHNGAVVILYQPNAMPDSHGLCPFGTTDYSKDGGKVSCLVKSSHELAMTTWLDWALKEEKFFADTPVRLTAWGGAGGPGGSQTGSKPVAGGAGGIGGRASRTVDMATLQSEMKSGNGRLYVLIGDVGGAGETSGYGAGGGASTTVTIGTSFANIDPTANPADTAVTLMAGGGGGGGSALTGSKGSDGYPGGAGGIATSTSEDASTPGDASCQGTSGVTGASGGNNGKAGNGDVKGTGGIGGYGGGGSAHNTLWIPGSISGPSNWTAGVGAIPKNTGNPGGGGGGGWGGGGAAPHGTNEKGACGGGGGATWAAASTVPDNYPALGGSPNTDKGAFELYYQLPSQSPR